MPDEVARGRAIIPNNVNHPESEPMAIGRNYAQALQKALRSLEKRGSSFHWGEQKHSVDELREIAKTPTDGRIVTVQQALRLGASVEQAFESVEQRLEALEEERLFSGPYDQGDALVTVNAGAGGTDSRCRAPLADGGGDRADRGPRAGSPSACRSLERSRERPRHLR